MEIKEFGQIIAREVKDKLGEDYSIDYSDVLKNNGVVYHALTIREKEKSVAPTIYIDGMFEEYNRGKLLMGLVDDVVNIFKHSIPGTGMDIDFFFDFSKVSEKLFYKVVNYKRNKEKLKEVPIKRVMDLALVPLCFYKNPQIGNGSIMITKSHLKEWEISEEELWENVAENAVKLMPLKVKGLPEFLERMTGGNIDVEELCGIYVMSNSCGDLGAATIFYPGALKEIADDHECDLYVIPSSIHECIIIPEAGLSMDTSFIKMMIREVNRSTVSKTDYLSDNLYRYDRDSDRLFIVKE